MGILAEDLMKRRDRKLELRRAIVERAARRHGCSVGSFYLMVLPDAKNLVMNLNRIPRKVFRVALNSVEGGNPNRRRRPRVHNRHRSQKVSLRA
jgi:hypothetical protein